MQEFHTMKTQGNVCCNLATLFMIFLPVRAIILAYGMVNASHIDGGWRQREIAQHG
jgi:hypothetical protein